MQFNIALSLVLKYNLGNILPNTLPNETKEELSKQIVEATFSMPYTYTQ